MLRQSSPVERVLTYATFLALSVALHMVAILGTRPADAKGNESKGGVAATSSQVSALPPSAGGGGALR